MRPNFKDINIKTAAAQLNAADWNAANKIEKNWITPEQIPVKPVYTKEDLEGMEHLNYAAGVAPYLRGPCVSMPVSQLPKSQMRFIAVTWLPVRKVCRLRST
jgi:methylmalonyl-CoA mutase